MSIMEILEVEEFVGRQWHRLIADCESYPTYDEAAVELDQVRGALSVFFRALGGEQAVEIAGAGGEKSHHRLTIRQKLGMEVERQQRATLDGRTLMLPERIAFFSETDLNRDLYFWLAAFFAVHPGQPEIQDGDPLRRDLAFLRTAYGASQEALKQFPGLYKIHDRLCAALRQARPERSHLPAEETAVEAVVRHLLGEPVALDASLSSLLAYVKGEGEMPAGGGSRKYRPFLPVPLWGEMIEAAFGATGSEGDSKGGSAKVAGDSKRKRRAERRELDQAKREDSFFVNVYDKLMTVADMINVNLKEKDDDEEGALQAADDLDRITVTDHQRSVATKIKMDLDLPANELDESRVEAKRLVPEWNYRKQAYLPDYCAVTLREASEEGEDWQPDAETMKRIRRIRRQFEAFRNKRQQLKAQPEGNELDLEALVRARGDMQASGICSDRLYINTREVERDIAVSILMDVSLSTDSWLDNQRVIDVEKEALAVLANGLEAAGDDLAIHTFTSRKRNYVRIERVKGFEEKLNERVLRRISALKPGYYTRIGAAIRAVAEDLEKRPNRQKLLLILTDGKPNDVDHYEGRYGIEDARKAVQECRRKGLTVFGVTIDQEAKDYFPVIFGRGAFHIVGHVGRLSNALPKIYRQLVKGA